MLNELIEVATSVQKEVYCKEPAVKVVSLYWLMPGFEVSDYLGGLGILPEVIADQPEHHLAPHLLICKSVIGVGIWNFFGHAETVNQQNLLFSQRQLFSTLRLARDDCKNEMVLILRNLQKIDAKYVFVPRYFSF